MLPRPNAVRICQFKSSELVVPSSRISLLSLPRELQIAILMKLDYAGLMVCKQVCDPTPSSMLLLTCGTLRYAVYYEISWELLFCNTNASWSTPPWLIVRISRDVHHYVPDGMLCATIVRHGRHWTSKPTALFLIVHPNPSDTGPVQEVTFQLDRAADSR